MTTVGSNSENSSTFPRRATLTVGAALSLAVVGGKWLPRTAGAQATPVASVDWSAVDALFEPVAQQTTLLAAELIDGVPETIHAFNADADFPVGSTFKFWILGALALKIQAGEMAWDDEIAIEERYKSVPGGDLRYALDGTVYTLRYLAERMMQKSDNSATDHLFYLVGRENVEAAMAAMGHSNPALNTPIFSTREMVHLKFVMPKADLDAYLAMPADERREVLVNVVEPAGQAGFEAIEDVVEPTEIFRVEWFANRNDLAATVAWMQTMSAEPGLRPLTEVIALETQLPFDAEVWPYVGFKGGSEAGVLSGTWLLHRADGRRFVYSVGFADTGAPIDMTAAVAAMEAGRDALAEVL